MASKVTINTATKIIKMNSGVTSVNVRIDLYSDIKEDWLANANLSRLQFPFIVSGGDSIGGGQVSPSYFFLRFPWTLETSGTGDNVVIETNLYAFDEAQLDTRDPFNILSGDNISNKNSDIPGISDLSTQIISGIFDEQIASHTISGSFGEWINKKALTVAKFLRIK